MPEKNRRHDEDHRGGPDVVEKGQAVRHLLSVYGYQVDNLTCCCGASGFWGDCEGLWVEFVKYELSARIRMVVYMLFNLL